MDFSHNSSLDKRKKADALIIPFVIDSKGPKAAFPLDEECLKMIASPLQTKDFVGKEGEISMVYLDRGPEKRAFLIGLGKPELISAETLRKSYGILAKECLKKRYSHLNVILPALDHLDNETIMVGVAEGLMLPNYQFHALKSKLDDNCGQLIQTLNWISPYKDVLNISKKVAILSNAVDYARDLVNGNADDVTSEHLVLCANGLSKEHPTLKTTIFDRKRLEKEGMGLILAVNRGSLSEPALIVMEYAGNPESKDVTIVVGKGVTYDTGGLNLKPTGGMETMKCDMAGAAACFGAILAVADLGLKVNLTIVVPTTENSISATSFKPGDVYKSYLGKTVEMTNSDAEGRLILADALAYAVKKLKPTRLIDLATLTGAIDIALGAEASGLMSTNDKLANSLITAGEKTHERLWRMPLYNEYEEKLKSDIADIKSWNGRSASSNVAAMFLKYFVADVPWAHLDIASTAYTAEPKKYQPKYATGVGVRLIVEFLEQLSLPGKKT